MGLMQQLSTSAGTCAPLRGGYGRHAWLLCRWDGRGVSLCVAPAHTYAGAPDIGEASRLEWKSLALLWSKSRCPAVRRSAMGDTVWG
jgi:hypothetical protein